MTYDPKNMTVEQMFDALRWETDEHLVAVINALEERWVIASSAAAEYVRVMGLAAKQRQQILDAEAVFSEHHVG